MLTDLPGQFFGVYEDDIVSIYLAMPFGSNGSPSHFAVFGDALTLIRGAH